MADNATQLINILVMTYWVQSYLQVWHYLIIGLY